MVQTLRTNASREPPSPESTLDDPKEPSVDAAADIPPILTRQYDSRKFVPCKLQPNEELGRLLKFCFDELELYYPCIDRADFYSRLTLLFAQHCSYDGETSLIPRQPEWLAFAALICGLTALGTYLNGGSLGEEEPHEGDKCGTVAWEWHFESRKLLAEYSWNEEPCLDLVRLHILEVLFFTMMEKTRSMSMARAMVVELAFTLDLNNEAAWGEITLREREYRRLLWWMVYIIDRRLCIRTARPYLIHSSEFVVGEFNSLSPACYLSGWEAGPFEFEQDQEGRKFCKWPQPLQPTGDWIAYLQFNIRWSKIATQVFDTCCSLRTVHTIDLDAMSAADARLIALEKSLEPALSWDQDRLLDRVKAGKADNYVRLRLIMFEVSRQRVTT
jgi:hypothetical protein